MEEAQSLSFLRSTLYNPALAWSKRPRPLWSLRPVYTHVTDSLECNSDKRLPSAQQPKEKEGVRWDEGGGGSEVFLKRK